MRNSVHRNDPTPIDLQLDGYEIGFSSAASARDDHGLNPVTGGQHIAVTLWTDGAVAAREHVVGLGAVFGIMVWPRAGSRRG
uniref:Uncharacterized protein n=1 Tax=uncultured soil bacterium TaxID=164851 RepID=E2D2Q8_9BACT|nr:hypothetical protein [uncultured soil bacterium]